MNKGILYGLAAYGLWGLLPVYWKWLREVPAPELLSHRILWSCVALVLVLFAMRRWPAFRAAAFQPRVLQAYFFAAVLIGLNWLTYVWAVNAGHIVETSLGYFINPLLSVLMGVIFLRERLRAWQWVACGVAAAGVLYLTVAYGSLPWIALTLASTFGVYGLVKKLAPLGSLEGLTLETAILFLPALVYLLWVEGTGQAAFLHTGWLTDVLLIGAGLATTIPLLLFASGVQRIPLSVIGLLQYIAPTLQFLLGVFLYGEPFPQERLIGFIIVWAALLLFGAEGALHYRRQQQALAPVAGD
ncbi:MAG: EamA family transporter RarD [Anaerolineales bacterium]|nr:EamA family transporter RarD [Anaerolineales bacterium]